VPDGLAALPKFKPDIPIPLLEKWDLLGNPDLMDVVQRREHGTAFFDFLVDSLRVVGYFEI
jgi:hypothetical protein